MAFLAVIVAAFIGAAFWYLRMRGPEAANDVINAAGHAKGAYNRRKFRKKVEGATLAGVEDPGLAAAVVLFAIAEAGPGVRDEHEDAISEWLRDVVEYPDTVEALAFAKWAAREVPDVNDVVRRLLPVWRDRLAVSERLELIDAANRIARIADGPEPAQADALRRLKDGLNV